MKVQILLLCMFMMSKATHDDYLTEDLGVSQADQEKYIRDLAKYFFKKSSWKQVFDENACPEFKEPVYEDKCIAPDDAPIQPLPPMTVCQFNPDMDGCPEDPDTNPGCTKDNMRLCQPPLACDLDQFKNKSECGQDVQPDCEAELNHPKCRFANKCDVNDDFRANLEECKDPSIKDPCRENAALCLTKCDVAKGDETLRCLIERCDLYPEGENCHKCDVCRIERTCTEHNVFTDPRCCPDVYCNDECQQNPEKCPVLPPSEKCEWGSKVGEKLSEIFYEPVQRRNIDENGLTAFYNCLNDMTRERQTIEVKCFENGMEEGFVKLTEEVKEVVANFREQYKDGQVEDLVNTEEHIKLEGKKATSDSILDLS